MAQKFNQAEIYITLTICGFNQNKKRLLLEHF